MTLAAALGPARRAGSISPIEALKARSEGASARRARLGWLVVVFVSVAIAGLLVWPRGIGDAGVVRALLVYAILLIATLLLPVVLRPLTRAAGAPFALLFRLEERLARGSLTRDRSRAILTIGPLAVGLAAVVALGAVGQNARMSAGAWIADVIPGDVVATSIRPDRSGRGGRRRARPVAGRGPRDRDRHLRYRRRRQPDRRGRGVRRRPCRGRSPAVHRRRS